MVGLTVSSVTDTETGALLEYSVGQASFGASLTIKLPEKYRTTYVCTVCTCGTKILFSLFWGEMIATTLWKLKYTTTL